MSQSRETPLTAVLTGNQDPEAELVMIETTADVVALTFDDGLVVTFDRVELHAATAWRDARLRSVA